MFRFVTDESWAASLSAGNVSPSKRSCSSAPDQSGPFADPISSFRRRRVGRGPLRLAGAALTLESDPATDGDGLGHLRLSASEYRFDGRLDVPLGDLLAVGAVIE